MARLFDFDDVLAEIRLAFEDMSGDDIATHYNRLIDPTIVYLGDGQWQEVESETD